MHISYQTSDRLTIDWLTQNLPRFLFPDLSQQRTFIQKPFLGVLAHEGRKPVGLILATSGRLNTDYRIHSWLVHPDFRRRKIGSQLLLNLEKAIRQKGGQSVDLLFKSHWKSVDYIKTILHKQHWATPELRFYSVRGTVEAALTFFPKKVSLPIGYSLLPFGNLNKSQVVSIERRYGRTTGFDSVLYPLVNPRTIDQKGSFFLQFQGQIIGWIVAHRVTSILQEITALFLEKNHRKFRLAYYLIQQVLQYQERNNIPKIIFTTPIQDNAIANLINRHKHRTEGVVRELYYVYKSLANAKKL